MPDEIKRKQGAQPGHPHYRPPGSNGAPLGHPPYPGCETGGRPEIWTDEMIEKIADYFMEYIEDPANLYFKKFVIWLYRNHNIKIQAQYLSQWAEKNEKFAAALDYARLTQECKIVEGSLIKKFDSGMSKFILSAVHGMSDKQVIEHQGNDVINIIHYGKLNPKTWKEENQEQ